MAIQYGDILLNNDGEIYSDNGDLASGDGIEQQSGGIINAASGNFRKHPTLAADLAKKLDGPNNSRDIAASISDAVFLDGWRLNELDINTEQENTEIIVRDIEKITDNTESLV